MANGLSKNTFKQFKDIAKAWIQIGKCIYIQQIPGYIKIKENEIVNRKAKKYSKLALAS